ncbi:hypothetical protein ACQEVB_14895 [Pseudonocardia sp. CA-107938]|uniref:hypothetical protein n=1 Tax=Pseudonocardia sp. CA-107938 TaxID=3240021 RepID=UPI003D8C3415
MTTLAVAVIGTDHDGLPLARRAAEIGTLAGVDAEVVVLPEPVDAARVERLPERYRVVYLTRTDPRRAHEVGERAAERDQRLVVTDQDGIAAALCAAALTHLRTVERSPDVARVVVAGDGHLPGLVPLLMIAGMYDLVAWQDAHAAAFPWERAVQGADVVIDLRPGPDAAAQTARIALDRPEGSVLRPVDAVWADHVVAGVLRVALACPPGSMHVELDMLRTVAVAIAATTPPPGHGRLAAATVTDLVAAAVRRTIDPRLAELRSVDDLEGA